MTKLEKMATLEAKMKERYFKEVADLEAAGLDEYEAAFKGADIFLAKLANEEYED